MFKNSIDKYVRRAVFLLLISQWLPCPLAIWAFDLDGSLVKSYNNTNAGGAVGR